MSRPTHELKNVGARIRQIVAHVLRHRFDLPSVPDEIAFSDLATDALERVYIAHAIEEQWNIALADAEIDSWETFVDMENSVRTKRNFDPSL
jgi:acyl carrier protein